MDTLYELISYYTKHSLATEKFRTYLITPCPQPQPHLDQSWFSDKADKQRAEELLNTLKEDGAFLIRYSSSDPNVFVLSLRVEGEIWHYRLKRDGRIFVVNQTVFENLNQIVDYYQQHPFVRGVSLRFPVNERNVGQFAQADSNNTPGFYLDLSDLEKEVEAIALQAYSGPDKNYLSFPVNAVIKVISKNNNLNDMWRGRYEHSTGLFPPEVVKELSSNMGNGTSEAVSHITIELANTNVEKWEGDKPFGIRISGAGHWNTNEWILAADNDKEMFEWYNNIKEKSIQATSLKFINIKKEKTQNIAVELSNLVVYCQASPFNPNFMKESRFYEMCSLSESKHDKLIEKGLLLFNTRHLSRVYPQASRLTSTNFMPVAMWNTGCHMVALNYQTADKPMQLNQGKFQANGRCGYILKPTYLMDETFRMENSETVVGNFPINLKIEIIAGRQLVRSDKSKGICSPFVDIEIIGLPFDCQSHRTTSISSNGLNPMWKQIFTFKITCPEMALLKFYVEDGDFVGAKSDPFIGQAVYPVDCLRGGYRSVPLLNQSAEPQELSALLIHVEIESTKSPGTKILQPHHQLQAGRSVHGQSYSAQSHRSYSTSSSPNFNNSLDLHSGMHSPLHSPSTLSTHSIPAPRKISLQPRTSSIESTDSQQNGNKKNGILKWWKRK
uniref:Phosphoinositide phospholipase C n=1 Tax=Panagrolaimus davidi TaxID=227884 RepID=A0A914QYD6_9BILA